MVGIENGLISRSDSANKYGKSNKDLENIILIKVPKCCIRKNWCP